MTLAARFAAAAAAAAAAFKAALSAASRASALSLTIALTIAARVAASLASLWAASACATHALHFRASFLARCAFENRSGGFPTAHAEHCKSIASDAMPDRALAAVLPCSTQTMHRRSATDFFSCAFANLKWFLSVPHAAHFFVGTFCCSSRRISGLPHASAADNTPLSTRTL